MRCCATVRSSIYREGLLSTDHMCLNGSRLTGRVGIRQRIYTTLTARDNLDYRADMFGQQTQGRDLSICIGHFA